MSFSLPDLAYDYSALEPCIDTTTMQIHHTKHHAGYIAKLNQILENFPDLQEKTITNLVFNISSLPQEIQIPIRNNGGGHLNHSLFWTILTPDKNEPDISLLESIKVDFGSLDAFKNEFSQNALNRFGSGWAWLVVGPDQKLKIISTPNQDSPLMQNITPLLGLDVWEHAYYLKYQNRRIDYIEAFWQIVNWRVVAENLEKARKI